MFIFAKQSQTLQNTIKLSYLKAFFIQKAIIFTKKLKTSMQNAVFTLNAYDHLFLMSVNGKNDVIKGPVLPSVLRLANKICLDKIFWQNLILRANNCCFIKQKTFWWENTRGMHVKCLM